MALDDILKLVPIDDIAEKFGVSADEARSAVEKAGGTLLGGLAKNAQSDEGSAAIEKALKKHEGASAANKVDEIDVADGGKIVKHILGEDESAVAQKLGGSSSGGIDFGKLLPILAPIVMGLIANANKDKTSTATAGQESGGGIGDLIGGLLGGGSGSSGGGFDIGSILGGLGGLFGKK